MSLTPSQFVERWRVASLSERSGAQSHFIDLCDMLGQPHPAAADGIGERFTFQCQKSTRILTSDADTTTAGTLSENKNLWAYGSQAKRSFDVSTETAIRLLGLRSAFGRNYKEVIRPSFNGGQLLDRTTRWVIDFGESMTLENAMLYEAPFEYVKAVVRKERANRREKRQQTHWWLHARPSPKYRSILRSQSRYVATAVTSKHRVFVWLSPEVLVDHAIVVFTREDDYFFGVLHSATHELWSRAQGTQVREAESGFRYTPKSTFMTFPFPWPPGTEPSEEEEPRVKAIADAARELVRLRDAWLNPPNAPEDDLRERTLTKLYNKRPAWLENAHQTLDRAVFAAYGLAYPLSKDEILRHLLELNRERAAGRVRVLGLDLPPKKSPGVERLPKQRPAEHSRRRAFE